MCDPHKAPLSRSVQTTADSSHLAVMIRQRKDEELLDLQSKEKSLVVGRGRLSEKDIFEMLESVRYILFVQCMFPCLRTAHLSDLISMSACRLDPEENNPMVLAKRYNLGIHSVILITSSVRSPTVLSDAEGNLYAV